MSTSILHTTERIAELLYEHDCLIVPGLGAFVSSRRPAVIDKKRGLLFPPCKEIVFNKSLCHNDGVLVGYVAEAYGVSIDEANGMVVSFVEEVKRQLKARGSVALEGVGVLRMFGTEVSFVADSDVNYLVESYGLSAQPICVKPSANVVKMRNYAYLKHVAASVAVLVGLMMVAPETRDASVENGYSQANIAAEAFNVPIVSTVVSSRAMGDVAVNAENSVEVLDNAAGVDAGSAMGVSAGSGSNIAEDASSEGNMVSEVSREDEKDEKFYIIVGSFRTEREADTYISSMVARGVSGLDKLPSNGRYRVSAGCFETHAEAVRNNKSFRNISGFENAWVLRDKK